MTSRTDWIVGIALALLLGCGPPPEQVIADWERDGAACCLETRSTFECERKRAYLRALGLEPEPLGSLAQARFDQCMADGKAALLAKVPIGERLCRMSDSDRSDHLKELPIEALLGIPSSTKCLRGELPSVIRARWDEVCTPGDCLDRLRGARAQIGTLAAEQEAAVIDVVLQGGLPLTADASTLLHRQLSIPRQVAELAAGEAPADPIGLPSPLGGPVRAVVEAVAASELDPGAAMATFLLKRDAGGGYVAAELPGLVRSLPCSWALDAAARTELAVGERDALRRHLLRCEDTRLPQPIITATGPLRTWGELVDDFARVDSDQALCVPLATSRERDLAARAFVTWLTGDRSERRVRWPALRRCPRRGHQALADALGPTLDGACDRVCVDLLVKRGGQVAVLSALRERPAHLRQHVRASFEARSAARFAQVLGEVDPAISQAWRTGLADLLVAPSSKVASDLLDLPRPAFMVEPWLNAAATGGGASANLARVVRSLWFEGGTISAGEARSVAAQLPCPRRSQLRDRLKERGLISEDWEIPPCSQ